MPRTLENNGYKTLCPCCPFTVADGRSDNIRRHTKLVHKEIPWDYRDRYGYHLNKLSETLGIKYNPTTAKYGNWGYCFKCGTHISCNMSNPVSKVATINAHTCARKQERERRTTGVSTPREKRTMTGTAAIEDILKRMGATIELDEDLRLDLEKTIRQNKGRFAADSLWNDLKKSPKVGKACRDKEDEMREEHADDADMPEFSQLAAVEYFIEAEGKAVRSAQAANRKVKDLREELEKREEEMEDIKIRSAKKDVRIDKLLETIKFMSASEKGDRGDTIAHQ